uniref:Dirigent protein n=1 Tax=Panagrellus redivivus TaxID=6233 RepID=A0A7E4ZUD8_PANRE
MGVIDVRQDGVIFMGYEEGIKWSRSSMKQVNVSGGGRPQQTLFDTVDAEWNWHLLVLVVAMGHPTTEADNKQAHDACRLASA